MDAIRVAGEFAEISTILTRVGDNSGLDLGVDLQLTTIYYRIIILYGTSCL